jgi:hypothetical protein
MKEAMKEMTDSMIETQDCIQMEKIYDRFYFKMEKIG